MIKRSSDSLVNWIKKLLEYVDYVCNNALIASIVTNSFYKFDLSNVSILNIYSAVKRFCSEGIGK